MFVSGETGEPSHETTGMIEEIVQKQVIEILVRSTEIANRRGTRTISVEDIFFVYRHDKGKVSRLRNFLSWKDVRKTAKDSDDKPGGGDEFAGGEELAPSGNTGNPMNPADAAAKGVGKHKRAKVRLPWDVSSYYASFGITIPDRDDDEEDEEDEEMNAATLLRLKTADERTRNMTKEEYVHWSECRQASFTFRKAKRFREWAGFGVVTESKPNDDVVDMLGFLTYEVVQALTEEALKVKASEDAHAKIYGASRRERDGNVGGDATDARAESKKRKREVGLFEPPGEEKTAVNTKHVLEAFRLLQQPKGYSKALGNFSRHQIRKPLQLVSKCPGGFTSRC